MSDLKGLFCLRCGLPPEGLATEFCSNKCRDLFQAYRQRLQEYRKARRREMREA